RIFYPTKISFASLDSKSKGNQVTVSEDEPDYKIISINDELYPPLLYDYLLTYNSDGLGAIIQPRSYTILRFKIRPIKSDFIGSRKFTVLTYNETFFSKFIENNIDNYKSNIYSNSNWNYLAAKLILKAKLKTNELLYETVNELSANGVQFYRLDQLLYYHINRLDGAFFIGNILNILEFEIIPNELVYSRSYPHRFSLRNTKNIPFGLGWSDNLNLKLIKNENLDTFTIKFSGNEHLIEFKNSPRSYFSDLFDIDYNSTVKKATIMSKTNNLIYEYDLSIDCLTQIIMNDKLFDIKCQNGKIIKLLHAELSIDFSYTSNNLLSIITKKTLDSPMQNFFYYYDQYNCLISSVNPWSTTSYTYD
ncbi:unnamed protein product, partial [Didymodactylos carnosus]